MKVETSKLERDRAICRAERPHEMGRLEGLRQLFDDGKFRYAFEQLWSDRRLVPYAGDFVLAWQPGISLIGLHLALDFDNETVNDIQWVGKLCFQPTEELGAHAKKSACPEFGPAIRCPECNPRPAVIEVWHIAGWWGLEAFNGDKPAPGSEGHYPKNPDREISPWFACLRKLEAQRSGRVLVAEAHDEATLCHVHQRGTGKKWDVSGATRQ